jgi:tetratricopeptide (TPR) repeat protein
MLRTNVARDAGVLVSAVFFLTGWSFLDPFHKHVEEGNRKAEQERQDEALQQYGEAAQVDPGSPIPDFNRGIVLSGKGEADAAKDAFVAAAASENPEIAADALYNLGNVLMESQEFGPAVESYLKSLDLDPDDADAQKNLEIAFHRLEEQQQQQQQQQDQQQDDQQEGEESEEQPQPQDEPSEDPNESQDENPDQGEQPEEEQEPRPEEGPPEERLTREDAERLLNAIESDELKVLQQLQETDEETKGVITNDW